MNEPITRTPGQSAMLPGFVSPAIHFELMATAAR